MIITVCNQQFDTQDIKTLDIKEGRVFIETEEDFFNIRYTNADEIEEAKNYLKFQTLTRKQLIDAVEIIMITCGPCKGLKAHRPILCPMEES